MKKIQKLLGTMLLSLLLLCIYQDANAQCSDCNQYLMKLYVSHASSNPQTGEPASCNIKASVETTIFNRVDFKFTDLPNFGEAYPLQVDFGSGTYQIVNKQDLITKIYPVGYNTIKVKDSEGAESQFKFNVRVLSSPYQAPDEIWDIANTWSPSCAGCIDDLNGGLAKAYIKYANPEDKKLRKVLLFVEGIDFGKDSLVNPDNNRAMRYGDFGWDVFYMGHKADTSWDFVRLMPQTRQAVQAKGYDMVLLDFRNGADYMQANGELLIKLLEKTYIL